MTVIIILALLALLLGAAELFIIPGFDLAGIGAIICAIVDAFLIYNTYGAIPCLVAVLVGLVVLGLMIWAVARSKTLDKIALHSTISSTNATSAQLEVKVGDKGVALTRLALVGNAEINGKSVEVKSAGAFINPGTPIRVKSVSEALITVVADED